MSAVKEHVVPARDFKSFAATIAARIRWLTQHQLFVADIDGQAVWDAYLAAFPEGTNPVYRVRTEHDGSYDRSFVRRMGNVYAVINGKVETIWGAEGLQYPYNEVCAVLGAKIKALPIQTVFLSKEAKLGYVKSTEQRDNGYIHTWYHFNCELPSRFVAGSAVDEKRGQITTDLGVFKRGLETITLDAVDSVLELIGQNTLYRGAEFKDALQGFRRLKLEYLRLTMSEAHTARNALAGNRFLWQSIVGEPKKYTLIRNTVIGQLLQDLSEGVDLEAAVRSYERMVAPTNYKRPTALITQRMVDDAAKTLEGLGLEHALQRRFATISDVSVNNVLWVNNGVQAKMKGGIAGLLAKDVSTSAKTDKAQDITIEAFIKDVLPKAVSIEALVKNSHAGNLVSLTAPVHDDAPRLFKWDNGFAWSYRGNITDSIKERVKSAGGNVQADLRVSLAWYNKDDLDLHSHGPLGHVFYGDKKGVLDVDMNSPYSALCRDPVENQSWMKPKDGTYVIYVNQYRLRETSDVGFTLELEANGQVFQYSYSKAIANNSSVQCLQFSVRQGVVHDITVLNKDIVGSGLAQDVWGIKTEQFTKVDTILASPNHWDDQQIGNKHWFFILEGCVNDEPTRGIYNEFLRGDLEQHRKVFEVLGNRTKCEPTSEQLSGVGFSSTQRNALTVRVSGDKLAALYTIQF